MLVRFRKNPPLSRQRIRCAVERGLPLAWLIRAQQQRTGFEFGPEPQLRLKVLRLHERSDVTTKGKQFALE